jgi:hypothetical protein
MPGFKIGNQGDGPNATAEVFRTHRFILNSFLGKPGNKPPFDMLKDVDLPDRIIEEIQIKTPGATYKFGKQLGYTDLKLVFYIPKDLLSKLEEMFDDVGNNKTGIQDFNTYMDEVVLTMQLKEQDFKFTFKNAWIGNISYGQLSYGSSELKLVTITVKFSWYNTQV